MKKIIYIVLIIFVILISIIVVKISNQYMGETQENLNIDKYAEIKKDFIEHDWSIDFPLSDIKDFCTIEKLFITKEGDLYKYSFNKLFTNENNYMKIETGYKFDRFIGNEILTVDNKLMFYTDELIETTGYFSDYSNLFFLPLGEVSPTGNTPYVYYEDGKLKYKLYNTIKFDVEEGVFAKLPNDEKFIKGSGFVIQTDKAYYKNDIINKEDLDKYEDIEPKYGLKKIENISDIYNEVYYYNGGILIFKNDMSKIYFTSQTDTFLYKSNV